MILALLLVLVGCAPPEPTPPDYPAIEPAALQAGAAEGTLDLPVGTPLAGYSARCGCLSGWSKQDSRNSAYNSSFVASTGVHMRPGIKVVWLHSGGENLVIAKADVIYSWEGLVTRITEQLEQQTGLDLKGKVVLATAHSHASYGAFDDSIHFYLGSDLFNEEIYQRFAQQVTDVALQAYDTLQPAAIGTGWVKDWDPNDEIYHDRRSENNDLKVWDDMPAGYGKDPYLNEIRVDTPSGDPIALMFTFGIHGIELGDHVSMISPDSAGGLEVGVESAFDRPVVVMHLQGGAGDASPSGRGGNDFAKVESLGELARGPIMDLYDQIHTSSDPIHLETASRSIWEYRSQIHVTRNGTVDWYYPPYKDGYNPDNVVYNEDGSLATPFDEFNTKDGAVFCGDSTINLPGAGVDAEVPPYNACVQVDTITQLLYAFFDIAPDSIPLPLPSSFKASTTVTRFGPIPTLDPDGTQSTRDLLVGFFPGEPTAMYTEQWRRRAKDELGMPMSLMVGYSQDHEGYLLIPEDWLMGGYEPTIAMWGPLQGEHIMERTLEYSKELLSTTDVRETPDPYGWYQPTSYADKPLPTVRPDETPQAGTRITEIPDTYVWVPRGFTLDLDIPAQIQRGSGEVQLLWKGGDPAVDEPRIILEKQDGDGAWAPVLTHAGRVVSDTFEDIMESWTPTPLYPASGPQVHTWWAVWQAANHDGTRLGLPLGTYRLHVYGKRYTGQAEHWPWDSADYEVTSDAFDVVPADLSVQLGDGGLWVWFQAPSDGYRLFDVDGSAVGANPIRGTVSIEVQTAGGANTYDVAADTIQSGKTWFPVDLTGATAVTVTDAFGNQATVTP